MHTAADRDENALQRLVRIKDNIEQQAKRDVQKLHIMLQKDAKREKLAKENKEFAVEDAKLRKEKLDIKRQNIRDQKLREMKDLETKGVREYQLYIKDIELKRDELRRRERHISELGFENNLKRHMTDNHSQSHFTSGLDRKEQEEQTLNRDLEEWDQKLAKGIQNSVFLTMDKALRAQKQTERIRQVQEDHFYSEK